MKGQSRDADDLDKLLYGQGAERIYFRYHSNKKRHTVNIRGTKSFSIKVTNLSRYMMERKLGRLLTKDEQVHHINTNQEDDRLENLEVKAIQNHKEEHEEKWRLKARVSKPCAVCGTEIHVRRSESSRINTCTSRECRRKYKSQKLTGRSWRNL